MIIGLSGPIGSGKDAAALILGKRGFIRRAFADALKTEVDIAINCDMRLPDDCPVTILELGRARDPWAKPTQPRMRALLQWWGTEYRRGADPDYWVNRLLKETRIDHRSFAVPDVRFPNEADAIRSLGGEVWMLTGRTTGNGGIQDHASERFDFEPDRVIDNSGSLDDLERAINECLSCLIEK